IALFGSTRPDAANKNSRWRLRRSRSRASAALSAVESLEGRTLLAATPTASFSNVTVTQDAPSTSVPVASHFDDPAVTGTVERVTTDLGPVYIELFDTRTPLTVANFLHYVNTGRYNGTIIHRSVPGFVEQGGGFNPNGNHIQEFGQVQNEPGIS